MEQDLRRQVLNILEKNSRLSPAEIAVMTGTDEQTAADMISALEKEGIICGYHTLINWDKENDDSVTALIELKVTPQGGDGYNKIAEQILRLFSAFKRKEHQGHLPFRFRKSGVYRGGAEYGYIFHPYKI